MSTVTRTLPSAYVNKFSHGRKIEKDFKTPQEKAEIFSAALRRFRSVVSKLVSYSGSKQQNFDDVPLEAAKTFYKSRIYGGLKYFPETEKEEIAAKYITVEDLSYVLLGHRDGTEIINDGDIRKAAENTEELLDEIVKNVYEERLLEDEVERIEKEYSANPAFLGRLIEALNIKIT